MSFRPLSSHKSETNLRNQLFSNNLVCQWNWRVEKDEPTLTALNTLVTMPRKQLNTGIMGTNGRSRAPCMPNAICAWIIAAKVGEPALGGTPAAPPSLAMADCILLENNY
jgi:hypothetical protein